MTVLTEAPWVFTLFFYIMVHDSSYEKHDWEHMEIILS